MHLPSFSTPWIIQSFASLLLAILFLQSGLDKVLNRQANLDWTKAHFEKSPLASTAGRMFLAITILEVIAGVLSGLGFLLVVFTQNTAVAYWGAIVATLALTCLFFGQRVAQDYGGAAILVPYLLMALLAIWVLRTDPLVAL